MAELHLLFAAQLHFGISDCLLPCRAPSPVCCRAPSPSPCPSQVIALQKLLSRRAPSPPESPVSRRVGECASPIFSQTRQTPNRPSCSPEHG